VKPTLAKFFGLLELQGDLETVLSPGVAHRFKNSCRIYLDERPDDWGLEQVFEIAWKEIEKYSFGDTIIACFIRSTESPEVPAIDKNILSAFCVDITAMSSAVEMPIEEGESRQLAIAYEIDRATLKFLVQGILRRYLGGEPYLPYDARFFSKDLTIMCNLYDDRGMDFATFDFGDLPAPLC